MRIRDRRGAKGWQTGLGHAERPKNTVLEHVLDRPAGDLFNDQAKQNVIRIRVMDALAQRKVGLVLEGDREEVLRIPHFSRLGVSLLVEALVVTIIVESAGHIEQVADGNVVAVRNLRLIRRHRVVEPQLAFIDQLQDDRPGKGLGDAGDPEMVIKPHWRLGRQITDLQSRIPGSLARHLDEDYRPWYPQLLHLCFDQWLERCLKRRPAGGASSRAGRQRKQRKDDQGDRGTANHHHLVLHSGWLQRSMGRMLPNATITSYA